MLYLRKNTMTTTLKAEKEDLIESLGVYLEQEKQTPPLAARIMAMLIINGKIGTTFEQLVAELGASKSTICTHLNSLTAQEQIVYFTKSGDRKRYYSMVPDYIGFKIRTLIAKFQKEIELQQKIIKFKNDFNTLCSEHSYPIEIHKEILEYLRRVL